MSKIIPWRVLFLTFICHLSRFSLTATTDDESNKLYARMLDVFGRVKIPEGHWKVNNSLTALYNETCPIMKARYNMQGDPRAIKSHQAVWYPNNETESQPQPNSVFFPHLGSHRSMHLLLMGNSFLRQVYESIYCMHSDKVKHIVVGKKYLADFVTTPDVAKHLPCDKIRPFTLNPELGCHDNIVMNYYLGKSPPSQYNCVDSASTIEFHGGHRVTFLFRPSIYQSVYCALERIGVDLKAVDVVVHNEDNGGIYPNRTFGTYKHMQQLYPRLKLINFSSVLEQLIAQQIKSLGYHFCASNRGTKCDFHPGMPGIPDWEAFILFRILHAVMK